MKKSYKIFIIVVAIIVLSLLIFFTLLNFDNTKSEKIMISEIKDNYNVNENIILSGFAKKNSNIILLWNGQYGLAKTDYKGRWAVNLGKMPEGKYNLKLFGDYFLNENNAVAAQIAVSKLDRVSFINNISNFFAAGISALTQKPPEEIIIVSVPKDTPPVLQGRWNLIK